MLRDDFMCSLTDDGNELAGNAANDSGPRLELSTGDVSGSVDMKNDDCGSYEFNVVGSAEAVVDTADEAKNAVADAEPVTRCQPAIPPDAAFTPSEQGCTAEVLSSPGSSQPNPPEVPHKKKKQVSACRKRSQKRNAKADHGSTKVALGTWEVSTGDGKLTKNVVRIRRQHPTEISDAYLELPISTGSIAEVASSESPALCERSREAEEDNLSGNTGEGFTVQESVPFLSCDPDAGDMKTGSVETDCTKADIPDDISTKTVATVASTDDRYVTGSKRKRYRKVTVSREACRKSQRCSARQRASKECADSMPVNASSSEVRTYGLQKEDAEKTGDEAALSAVSASRQALCEQVTSAHTSASNRIEVDLTPSVVSQTQAGVGSCDPAVSTCSSVVAASSVDDVQKPEKLAESVTSAEYSDLVPETASESQSMIFADRLEIKIVTSGHQSLPNAASSSSSSSCPGDLETTYLAEIKDEVKAELPVYKLASSETVNTENNEVKQESDSYLSADANLSSQQSTQTSVFSTCFTATTPETFDSQDEHLSDSSVIHPQTANRTDSDNSSISKASNNVNDVSVNAQINDDTESEEVCKMILEEVVANIVQETCCSSVSKTSIQDADLLLTESSGPGSSTSMAQIESDSTSGEIPIKKRRGRRIFADCQPTDAAAVEPRRSENSRRSGISFRPSSQSRKISRSCRHPPRGNKYVGAHTSVVGM